MPSVSLYYSNARDNYSSSSDIVITQEYCPYKNVVDSIYTDTMIRYHKLLNFVIK